MNVTFTFGEIPDAFWKVMRDKPTKADEMLRKLVENSGGTITWSTNMVKNYFKKTRAESEAEEAEKEKQVEVTGHHQAWAGP